MQQVKGHFVGNVTFLYTAGTNFLEKNHNKILLTAQSLFEEHSSELLKKIYTVQKNQLEESHCNDRDHGCALYQVSQAK